MLLVNSSFENSFPAGVERQQVPVVVRAAMQDAPLPVHRRVNQGARDAAILGLYVDRLCADGDVAVVAEDQGPGTYMTQNQR